MGVGAGEGGEVGIGDGGRGMGKVIEAEVEGSARLARCRERAPVRKDRTSSPSSLWPVSLSAAATEIRLMQHASKTIVAMIKARIRRRYDCCDGER